MKVLEDQRWINCLNELEQWISPQEFELWFKFIRFEEFHEGILSLIVPSQFYYDWLTRHYESELRMATNLHFGYKVERLVFKLIIPTDWVYKEEKPKESSVILIKNVHEELLQDLKKTPELIHNVSPFEFEDLIAFLLKKKGYDIHQTPRSKDGGKDIIAKFRTPLGDNCACFVECKKYSLKNPVGVELIRSLYGVVQSEDVNLGMLVTTSRFTKGAKLFEKRHDSRLKLKDFHDLKDWFQSDSLIDTNKLT